MTVSPVVVVPVIFLVLFLRPIFFFLYFCRCELAFAVNIVRHLERLDQKKHMEVSRLW